MPVYFGDLAIQDAPIIVAYRHAHRHFEDPLENGGLSELGVEQAQDAAKKIRELFQSYMRKLQSTDLPTLDLWTSPKKRCQETIACLHYRAAKKRISVNPVSVHEELNEQQSHESSVFFQNRVQGLLDSLENKKGMTVLCTHGDWIPQLHKMLTGESLHVAHAQAHVYAWSKAHHSWKYCGYLD